MNKERTKIRFNIVDALVLAAVVLVAAGVGYQMFRSQISQTIAPKVKLNFVAVAYNNRMHHVDAALSETLPSKMVAGNSVVSDAEVVGIDYEPCVVSVETADGRMVSTQDPERYDIYFTMEAIVPKDNAVLKVGAQEVRNGKMFVVKTRELEFNAYVMDIEVTDAP